jgi:hypothetical protein
MTKCYRQSTCRIRLHGEGACSVRFAAGHCPNEELGKEDDEETGAEEAAEEV